jgi:hypothetical protein
MTALLARGFSWTFFLKITNTIKEFSNCGTDDSFAVLLHDAN